MKKLWGTVGVSLAVAMACFSVGGAASAATVYDSSLASPGVYNGAGNPNEHFTVQTTGNIELGIGVQYRKTGPQVTPDAGTATYHVNTGIYTNPADFCTGTCALWNYQFSVNTNVSGGAVYTPLSSYSVNVDVLHRANGQHQMVPVSFLDNTYYGPTGAHPGSNAADYGLQNSQNLAFNYSIFQNPLFGFDPLANDNYLVTLSLSNSDNVTVASLQALIIAGDGLPPSAAPLPGALPLFASGLGALGLAALRRKRKVAKA
jgi:hypothetical protein